MRKNSIKNNRVSMEVQRELSQIIRSEVKDPRIPPLLSVTNVYVAPDLKTCRAYISVLGSREELDEAMEGLKKAAGFIRRRLAQNMNMRNTPEIRFIADNSIEYGVTMIRTIEEQIEEDERRRKEADEALGLEGSAEDSAEEAEGSPKEGEEPDED
ncbi:MAG: 30S ribosome-binding factor RbfA [Lachnospiraceae bacterium]|nr:30S ribosome-binding factor RbfA [Lachnospiraceae bacterium]